MPIRLTSLRQHRWLASFLVIAFALRALVPAGFMPGGDGRLGLQICPDGFPVASLAALGGHAAHAHHHPPADSSGQPVHDHKSWMSGHCVFSAVAGAPPISQSSITALVSETEAPSAQLATAPVSLDLRFRIAQPRGPPHLL